jgi:hypothetical protein
MNTLIRTNGSFDTDQLVRHVSDYLDKSHG